MNTHSKKRILLVEDDTKLSELMTSFLEAMGDYEVDVEPTGTHAVERILGEKPDIVVLDIMLPGKDGLAVCKEVRDRYNGPIMMLTALGDEVDEVVGIEIGADDYLSKPVNPRVLLVRIKNLLRRFDATATRTLEDLKNETDARRINLGVLQIDQSARTVVVDGHPIEFSTAEFDLLWLLASRAGRVVSREELYRDIRGIEWDGLDRSVDLRVARVRKKIGDDGKHPELIKSVRGTGYILAIQG